MKTAVDKVGRDKQRQVIILFSAMVSHFLFEAVHGGDKPGHRSAGITPSAAE
ncbi:hypothetical protein GCM10011335_44990 [Aureimonas glaciei]|uniref:Uncharacterized protein n=1 Tax=Aureimonas glaciei TaxID=1776957 RepID=A0A917DI39_9HYPH|nr:hypothetical protein GCM10011335_44990 [Aureimonas glaciei]